MGAVITGAGKGGSSSGASSCAQLRTPAACSGLALPMGLPEVCTKADPGLGSGYSGHCRLQQLCVCLVEGRDMVTPVHGPHCPQRQLWALWLLSLHSVTGSVSKGLPAVAGPRAGSQGSSRSRAGEAMTGFCIQALLMQDGTAVLQGQSLSTGQREGSPQLSLFTHASKCAFARHVLRFLPPWEGAKVPGSAPIAWSWLARGGVHSTRHGVQRGCNSFPDAPALLSSIPLP